MASGGIGFAISGAFAIMPPEPLLPALGAFSASAEQLRAWAFAAGEGDRCVYARVSRLPRGLASGELARKLAAQGALILTSPRSRTDPTLFDYTAKRTCLPIVAEAPPEPASEDVLTPEARRVLDFLSRLADQRAPCASNRGIAASTGLRDADAANYQLRRLSELGFIIRKAVPAEPGRVVTIVETGAQTGLIGR